MAFDVDNETHVNRLLSAVEHSKKAKKPFEEARKELLRQYVGEHYGEADTKKRHPINMIELGVSIFQRGIASHAPQALVDSNYVELLPYARNMELALNQQMSRINIRDSFNTCAIEALFCMGAMEVGITTGNTPANGEGYQYDPGHLFADAVLFEDLILDMSAKHWNQQGFIGHDFVVPLEWAKDNPNFNRKIRVELQADDDSDQDTDSNRLSTMGRREEFEDTIRLRQLFLPRQGLILLLAADKERLLQTIDWDGPENGPYHFLSFGSVPGNLIPLAPVPQWYDLDIIINEVFSKCADQAIRQKTIVGVQPHSLQDGQKVLESEDGDMIPLASKDVVEIRFGGVDQQSLGTALWAKDMLSTMAGNLDLLGGLSAQSRTVGQDQLMSQAASGRMQDMQASMREFQTAVIQDLAYWLWEDPISEYHIVKPIEGTQFSIPATFSPENRMGRFFDYNFSVSPYSKQQRSPNEQGAALTQLMQSFVLPTLPALQQEGKGLDWEDVFKTLAKLNDMPEIARWIKHLEGEMHPGRGPVEPPPMPQFSQRNYVRENRPAATQNGKDSTLARLMFGDNPQGAELGSLMRSG